MKKKVIAAALTVSLITGLCTGCGAGGSEVKETKAKETQAAGTDKENNTDTAKSTSGDNQVITFYGFSDWVDSEPYKAVYEQAKAEFEEENPGYTVELQSDPWGDWEQKYKTMFASGNPADVFMVNNPDFPVFANSGNVLDMGDYVEEGYFDQFFDGVLGMYKWEDRNMAIPFTTDCRVLWYNKDIFKEAGLDPETPPSTWEELSSMAKQIKEKTGKYGFGMDMGLKELPSASLFCASGSQLLNVDADGGITPNVNTDEFKGYLQTLLDMKETYEPDYANLDHHDVAKQFAEGQFGMIIGNTLTETDIYDKDFWGQALIPTMKSDTPKGSFGGGFGICVSSESKVPEAAVKFAQKLCDPKYNANLVSDIPASQKGLENSEFAKDPNYAVILDQIQYTKQSMPKTLYYSEIEAAAYDSVVSVVVGDVSIDDAIADLEVFPNSKQF